MMKKILILVVLIVCTCCSHCPEKYIYSTDNDGIGIVQEFKSFEQKRTGKRQYYILIRDIDTGSLKEMEVGRSDWFLWYTGDTIVGYNIEIETD